MTALGKLVRTTAFKLSLAYLTVFALFAAFLLAYFAWNTWRLITEQIVQTVDAEITGLSDQYRLAGVRRLVVIVDARSRRPGSSLYLVAATGNEGIAGNIRPLDAHILDRTGWAEIGYRRLDEANTAERHALVRVFQLPEGFRLLVGRDLEERERLRMIIVAAARWSIGVVVVLGLAGGFFITRRVLKRVDAITGSTQIIMAGDFSGRLPTAGTGDEFDRLADNLNAMLERIEALMRGLKEVSDNIAHDLKTPLTRLRNRAEAALRVSSSEADYRAALEGTIEESDALIRTFNALLMIARAESGQARDNMIEFDAGKIARDVGELYEPLAEEEGLTLKIDAEGALPVRGNRELVSQALANLIDNAIKYAAPQPSLQEEAAPGPNKASNGVIPEVTISARDAGDRIEFSVADTGPGIPTHERAHAVERFGRLESSRSQPGSGLGLSLASAVASLHGGELRLEDNNPGLRATLALPRAALRETAA